MGTVSETAQATFSRLLRDVVGPRLQPMAYVAQAPMGGPDETCRALVGFQKARESTVEVVKFTVNLKAMNREVWDEARRQHSYVKDAPPPGVPDRTGRRCAWTVVLAAYASTQRLPGHGSRSCCASLRRDYCVAPQAKRRGGGNGRSPRHAGPVWRRRSVATYRLVRGMTWWEHDRCDRERHLLRSRKGIGRPE